jgi:L-threonate 2-dehydrogenase
MQASAKGKVGVIGLGIMGGAIARNLTAAGWQVVGYDIDAKRTDELSGRGVTFAANVAEVVKSAPIVLVSLPSPDALQKVIAEIAAAGVAKRIVAELSTFTIEDKLTAEKVLRRAGHVLLDCPLSGTGAQARTRDLVVYASGDSKSIAALEPVFADFAREWRDLGAFGNGMRMKLVANLLVAIHNVATAEAFVLGMKAGLDPKAIFDLVKSGAGNSRVFELRGPMMVDADYDDATMKISVWQKDMSIIREFARSLQAPTPVFDATVPIYDGAMAQGLGSRDTAAVCAVLEAKAGLRR